MKFDSLPSSRGFRGLVALFAVSCLQATIFFCSGQTYVLPMMGGGQTPAPMAHIDISYDAEQNLLSTMVDDSEGIPQLRALPAGLAFDPGAPYRSAQRDLL